MSTEQAERLRQRVAAGETYSVSSYVAEAVGGRLDRDEGLERLEETFGRPSEEALAWARTALGAGDRADAR